MRLFVAIRPPRRALASLTAALPDDDRLRWTPHYQWHVTLAFMPAADPARVPDLRTRLGRAAGRTSQLRLRISGAGVFPRRPRHATVLWVGLSGDVEALRLLSARCVAAARRSGIGVDERTFRAHLTVARARGGPADLTAALAALAGYDGPDWVVPRVELVESRLSGRATHVVLSSHPLMAAE